MQPQEPLSREELEPLWRWERQVTWLQVGAMAFLLLAGVVATRFAGYVWLQHTLLGGFAVLVIAATALQMRQRCPRCRTRLRGKLLSVLPSKCAVCGVAFPREA